jgi:hypothetical protein
MAAPPNPHPIPNTGQYTPPVAAGDLEERALRPAAVRARANLLEGNSGDFHDLVDILRRIYPPTGGMKTFIGQPGQIGRIIKNNQPVADRQTLTMAASQHPLWTGSNPLSFKPGDKFNYHGPKGIGQGFVGADGKPRNEDGQELFGPGNDWNPAGLVDRIKAELATGDYEYTGPLPAKAPDSLPPGMGSQAIGDRSPTQMTNPLPNYQQLQMTKLQLIDRLRTLINQHVATQQQPLVNTPLLGAPTQMGRG